MIPITIEENRLEPVIQLLSLIPEFENAPSIEQIHHRIQNVPHLILTAQGDGQTVGFKIGYEREGRFYSWLGGVSPAYRKKGIAKALAESQEKWARLHGYKSVWMKTRNCFPEMLIMAIGRGFRIIGLDPRDEIDQHRIVLEKSL